MIGMEFLTRHTSGLAAPDQTVPTGPVVLEDRFPKALRARLRPVLSLRNALAEISQQHLGLDGGRAKAVNA
jgi:hypothetical protein